MAGAHGHIASCPVHHVLFEHFRLRWARYVNDCNTYSGQTNVGPLAPNENVTHLPAQIKNGQFLWSNRIRNIDHVHLPASTCQKRVASHGNGIAILPLFYCQLVLTQKLLRYRVRHVHNANQIILVQNVGPALANSDCHRVKAPTLPRPDNCVGLADKNRVAGI